VPRHVPVPLRLDSRGEGTSHSRNSNGPDLTFGEHVRLLENPKQWTRFAIQIDRKTFTDELKKVGEIRNDVMHFHPDGVGSDDLTMLRKFSRFLSELEKKLA
jgi:hypothetical protein